MVTQKLLNFLRKACINYILNTYMEISNFSENKSQEINIILTNEEFKELFEEIKNYY